MSATAGIGLRNSTTTDDALSIVRELPIATPSATPIATASARPWRYVASVVSISPESVPSEIPGRARRRRDAVREIEQPNSRLGEHEERQGEEPTGDVRVSQGAAFA